MENKAQEAPPPSTLENVLTAICAVTSACILMATEQLCRIYAPDLFKDQGPLALLVSAAYIIVVFVSVAAVGVGILHLFEKPGPRTITF